MTPNTVAVIGASGDRSKYGNAAVRAYARRGWHVYPVNGRGGTLEGMTAYASLRDVPVEIQRVTLYLPPEIGLQVLPDIAAANPPEFFVNPGAASPALAAASRELGLNPRLECSIVAIGELPGTYLDRE
jgi:predicted CoA-binding protein